MHLGEECDDSNAITDDYCSNDCINIGSCGDGIIQESAGEIGALLEGLRSIIPDYDTATQPTIYGLMYRV